MSQNRQAIKTWVDLLWPDGPGDGAHLLLWSGATKRSSWFQGSDSLALYAQDEAERSDVYLGVCCGPKPTARANYQRISKDAVTGLPGVAVDLDVQGPGHSEKTYFRAKSEVHTFLESFPLQPTATVDSGGGIQAWWLFEEPWLFDSVEERVEAANTFRGWVRLAQELAGKFRGGRHVDPTTDLARVLRLPGTFNRKIKANPRLVQLIGADGPRFNPSDFEIYRAAEEDRPQKPPVGAQGSLLLDPMAEPPKEKFALLAENHETFRRYWHRQIKCGDGSASAYDLALANICASLGQGAEGSWTDQEIADLLIANRRAHGDAQAKVRHDYLSSTIRKARQGSGRESLIKLAVEELREAPQGKKKARKGKGGETDTETVLGALDEALGLRVVKILAVGEIPDVRYSAVLADGSELFIGGGRDVFSQARWKEIAFLNDGEIIGPTKTEMWVEVVRLMQAILERDESGDATEVALWEGRIRRFAADAPLMTGADAAERFEAFQSYDKFVVEDADRGLCLAIHADGFRTWIARADRKSEKGSDVVRMLRRLKFVSKRFSARQGKDTVHRKYWLGPGLEYVPGDMVG